MRRVMTFAGAEAVVVVPALVRRRAVVRLRLRRQRTRQPDALAQGAQSLQHRDPRGARRLQGRAVPRDGRRRGHRGRGDAGRRRQQHLVRRRHEGRAGRPPRRRAAARHRAPQGRHRGVPARLPAGLQGHARVAPGRGRVRRPRGDPRAGGDGTWSDRALPLAQGREGPDRLLRHRPALVDYRPPRPRRLRRRDLGTLAPARVLHRGRDSLREPRQRGTAALQAADQRGIPRDRGRSTPDG